MRIMRLLVIAMVFPFMFIPAFCSSTNVTSKTVCLAFFGTSGCGDCDTKWNIITTLEMEYPSLVAMRFDYNKAEDRELENYLLFSLHNLSERSPRTAVFIGDDYLLGYNITESNLRSLIEKYLETGAKPLWKYIYVAFFGTPGCGECNINWDMITKLKEEYPKLVPEWFDYSNKTVMDLENKLFDLYGVYKVERYPNVYVMAPYRALFIGDHVLLDDDITEENLRQLILEYISEDVGTVPPWKLVKSESWFLDLPPFFAVIVGGLADGVNPCAFAVVVFFVSYLEYLGRRKREIALVGVSFIVAVFLTYFLIGTGILLFVRHLQIYPTVSFAVKVGVACFAIILGLVNIYDYYLSKRKGVEAAKLQLPRILKTKIHAVIRKTRETRFIVPFAFASGFIVSLFELACTGQVYLPVIALLSEPSLRAQAILYLILYNVMFILPLLIVFGVASFGVRSQKLGEFLRKHAGKMKLIIALILFILAVALLMEYIPKFFSPSASFEVFNPGFELDEDGNGIPDGWTKDVSHGYPTFGLTSDNPFNGSKCAYICISNESALVPINATGDVFYSAAGLLFSEYISIEPEVRYMFKVSYRGSVGLKHKYPVAYVELYDKNKKNKWLKLPSDWNDTTIEWQTKEYEFTIPPNYFYARVALSNYVTNETLECIYFDEVTLTKA
jgi:cytochrome c biogenesis protein CcdA